MAYGTIRQRVSIVVPTYNEQEAIVEVVRDVERVMAATPHWYEILVVNDGSTDHTAQVLAAFEGAPHLRVIHHAGNRGAGAACTTGVLHAQGDLIAMTDGDASYPAEALSRLIALMSNYDMSVGARIRETGTLPFLRIPAKWVLRQLASLIVGQRIPDLNSGLRVMRKDVTVKFLDLLPDSHSWVSTITLAFLTNGYAVAYVPIEYYTRRGRSSFHPVQDTAHYLNTIHRTILQFRPLRVFMPLTASVLSLGVGRWLFHAWMGQGIPLSDGVVIVIGLVIGSMALTRHVTLRHSRARYIKPSAGDDATPSGITVLHEPPIVRRVKPDKACGAETQPCVVTVDS